MKKARLLCLAALLPFLAIGEASAHGGGHWGGGFYGGGHYGGYYGFHGYGGYFRGPGVGIYFGPGWAWPYPYNPYYAYPPSVVTVPSSPPVYIQQGNGEAPPQESYWYYCWSPKGYYPYVKECPGGWQKVPPQPPRQ